MKPQKVEISHRTVIFTVLFLLSLSVLWQVRSLIVLIFICLTFMSALNPVVTRLEKFRIPRPLAILVLYILIVSLISFAVAGIIPVLVEQTNSLITTLPQTIKNTTFFGMPAIDISSQLKILETLPSDLAKFTIGLFSNIFSTFIIFVITFYLLMERKNFSRYSFDFFGREGKNKFTQILDQMERSLGRWVNAELLLMTIIGLLSYLGYLLLGLNYAVPLAIIAGLLEVVPSIGPTISAVLATIVGFTVSPLTALMALAWSIIVQQLENNYIVPKIMKETVGLNPLITILAIATGAQLGGVLGAVLAIPIFLTSQIIFQVLTDNHPQQKKLKETDKPDSV